MDTKNEKKKKINRIKRRKNKMEKGEEGFYFRPRRRAVSDKPTTERTFPRSSSCLNSFSSVFFVSSFNMGD